LGFCSFALMPLGTAPLLLKGRVWHAQHRILS
jgi:hypothetical protein